MKHAVRAVAASGFVAVAILLLSWNTYFAQLNYAAYDFTLRLAGSIEPTSPTIIVAIDEESLARISAWPWSRDKLAKIVERVESGNPKSIAIDLILDDRTNEEHDRSLSDAISKARSVVLSAHLDTVDNENYWRKPNEDLLQPSVRLGHVHADPDFDGITRRIISAKGPFSAFAIEALRGAGIRPSEEYEIRIDQANVLLPRPINIRYAGDNRTFTHVPAWKVLDGQTGANDFKDKIVLIGMTAQGIPDQWFTPFAEFGQRMSGVEIHANAIETLYADRAIFETSDLTTLASLWLFVALLIVMDRRFEGRRFYAAAVLSGPLLVALSWLLMKYFNVWFPFPPFLAAIVFAVPALEVTKLVRVNRDLDKKIEKLSGQIGGGHERSLQWDARERILSAVPASPERDAWLAIFDDHRSQSTHKKTQHKNLMRSPRHNARWKLDAVDYFNEELVRFLSFNNAILASIEDVIVVSDPAGRVVYQNPATKRLEGYREDPPFAPDYFSSLLNRAGFAADFAKVLSQQETVSEPFVAAKNGRDFFNISISPISRIGVVLSMHNATAQHELNVAKNDMVSLVSHELRTPLTSIRGYSDMLLKYNLVQDKGKEFLGTIIDESARLNQLIQSFLDIAYIESGRQKVTKTDFEIAPVLKDILNVAGPVAAEKGITLEGPANLDGMCAFGDRLLLNQALTNLVTNAIKYSPIHTTVRIGVVNGGGRLRFDVADQGFGIPTEETSKIFEKFYRRGNKETRQQSGFGLGLSFVKEVAARHGGDVSVQSEVGKGSVFTLWIPL